MLGGIKQSNMMLKSIVIFSDFPEQKTPVFLKFGVDVGDYLVRTSLFLIKQSRSSIGLDTEILGNVVDLGTRPQRGHGSSVPSLGSLAGSIEVRNDDWHSLMRCLLWCLFTSRTVLDTKKKRHKRRII